MDHIGTVRLSDWSLWPDSLGYEPVRGSFLPSQTLDHFGLLVLIGLSFRVIFHQFIVCSIAVMHA